MTPSRAQWRWLAHVADCNDSGRLALTAGPWCTVRVLTDRGWVRFVGREELFAELRGALPRRLSRDVGYQITADGRLALRRAILKYAADLRISR